MEGVIQGVFLTQEALQIMIDKAVKQATDAVIHAIQTKPETKDLQTYEEFSERYHVCHATIRNWAKNDIIQIVKMGNKRYIRDLNHQAITNKINGRISPQY